MTKGKVGPAAFDLWDLLRYRRPYLPRRCWLQHNAGIVTLVVPSLSSSMESLRNFRLRTVQQLEAAGAVKIGRPGLIPDYMSGDSWGWPIEAVEPWPQTVPR